MTFMIFAGDLLFQDIHCGPGCDAISGVTAGVLGVPVPQGEVGSNPAALSLSPEIEVVHQFGDVRGLPLA